VNARLILAVPSRAAATAATAAWYRALLERAGFATEAV
jgi:hypothetical protein